MTVPNEYRAARDTLLDVLTALHAHLSSLVLVGAQAIYLRLVDTDSGINVAPTTTDADVTVNIDLLAPQPDLAAALQAAHFTDGRQPGTWVSKDGIKVDLMVCPHQSGTSRASARAARLADLGHPDPRTARITKGLEPALVDHNAMTVRSMTEGDDRSFELNVAGPAAMLVAKLIKLQERLEATSSGGRDRVQPKDVLDLFRILQGTKREDIDAGIARHMADEHAAPVSKQALRFVQQEASAASRSRLRQIFAVEVRDDLIQLGQWDYLVTELAGLTLD